MPPVVIAIKAITAAIKAFAAFKVGSLAIGKFILAGAAVVATSAIARKLTPKPKFRDIHDRGLMVLQAIPPRRAFYGQGWISGPLAFPPARRSGANREFIHYVVLLAAHRCQAIEGLRVDGEDVALDGNGEAVGKYAGHLRAEFFLGSDDQAASALLQSSFPGVWTADHRLRGITYAHVRIKDNPELFPNGHPNLTFYVRGKLLYDPRGAPQEPPAWSENWALIVRDYLTEPDPDLGMGIPADEIADDLFIAAANDSDEAVALKAGGSEARYRAAGAIYSDEAAADVLPDLLAAGFGDLTYAGGRFGLLAGVWQPPVLAAITRADFRGVQPLRVQGRRPVQEVFNSGRGTFLPYDASEARDFAPVSVSAYVAADGQERWLEHSQRFVSSATQCQRLMRMAIEASRRAVTCEVDTGLRLWEAAPGNTVRLHLAEDEMLANGGHEQSATRKNWTAGVVVTDASKALAGERYLEFTASGGGEAVYAADARNQTKLFAVTAEKEYTFGGWLYRESGDAEVSFAISWFQSDGATPASPAVSMTPAVTAAQWTESKATAAAPADAAFARFELRHEGGSVSTVSRMDDATLALASGWIEKTFKVEQVNFVWGTGRRNLPTVGVTLHLREWDAGVFAWNPATDEQPEVPLGEIENQPPPLSPDYLPADDSYEPLGVSDFNSSDHVYSVELPPDPLTPPTVPPAFGDYAAEVEELAAEAYVRNREILSE